MVRGTSRFMVIGLLGIVMLADWTDKVSSRLASRWRGVLATVVGVPLAAETPP
jgi:hypothetical protein